MGRLHPQPVVRKPHTSQKNIPPPVQDEQALGQLLAELGCSRLSANLNQLAKAAHSGALPVTPEVHQAILDASRDIRAMSDLLVQALGLPEGKK